MNLRFFEWKCKAEENRGSKESETSTEPNNSFHVDASAYCRDTYSFDNTPDGNEKGYANPPF